jgi:hypothetical protein
MPLNTATACKGRRMRGRSTSQASAYVTWSALTKKTEHHARKTRPATRRTIRLVELVSTAFSALAIAAAPMPNSSAAFSTLASS